MVVPSLRGGGYHPPLPPSVSFSSHNLLRQRRRPTTTPPPPTMLPPFPAVAGTSCRPRRPQRLWVLPPAATAASFRGHSRSVQRPLPPPSPAATAVVYSDHHRLSWRLAPPPLLVSSAATSSGVQLRRLWRLLSPLP
ncbi:verprolin-like [Zingiber officinale]|uniref:verprolin-like n=1 Tax=Zingiber officinale TaxID=94328 RepID=UPI001C4CC502|nr:verprolin-like [Zingiber officinale]